MNCRRVESLLSNHLEGRLPEPVMDAVTAHVADCPACRRLRDDLVTVANDLREFATPVSSPDLPRRAVERWLAAEGHRRQPVDPAGTRSRFFA